MYVCMYKGAHGVLSVAVIKSQNSTCREDDLGICAGGKYPHPEFCNKYIDCVTDPDTLGCIEEENTCPLGLVYDEFRLQCETADLVGTCQGEKINNI